MTDSTREAAIKALFSVVDAVSGIEARRNEPETARIPAGGLVILHDGDPGEPDVLLSPVSYFFEHRAELVVMVQAPAASTRDAAMDAILQAIAAAIAADDTLGGAVDRAAPGSPEIYDEPVEGGESIKAVLVPVILEYVATSSLG